MTPQIPAEGILIHSDWGDSKMYEVHCNCTDPDHLHSVEVEADDFCVTVTTHTIQKSSYTYNFWESLKQRFLVTWNIWVNGVVKYEASIIMTEQQALNYAETLKLAINDVKTFKGLP